MKPTRWQRKTFINVLSLVRGDQRYVFTYDDSSEDALTRLLGDYAADPELSFSWYDAAVLSQRLLVIK